MKYSKLLILRESTVKFNVKLVSNLIGTRALASLKIDAHTGAHLLISGTLSLSVAA